ncbi:TetR/AcrR family transcriptional regulator [Sporomusa sp.]|uniref:TetR/AcrR family transcriptional regulator n=1 Tax=Sporomusa sp. TaxID=2078658 RepID=UPI002C50BE9B|nr:TetR/AcrR family transcriptional regulator [Sporomusa sp.]HWR45096.1 TetR/AcrR family transcriptional regulator [Sporomusa sp.]
MAKESIIIAALGLFLRRGYKSVSLIDVANELGITKGGIYHYFSSKDELLRTALNFFFQRFEAKYTDLLSDKYSIQEVLHSLMVDDAFERYSKELFGLERECSVDHMHFMIEMMLLFPDIQEKVQQSQVLICEAFAKRIQAAVEKGELKSNLDSYALAANIMAMVNGQKSLGSHFRYPEMRKRMMDNMWALMNT